MLMNLPRDLSRGIETGMFIIYLFGRRKHILTSPADGAYKIIGKVLKRRAGCNPLFLHTQLRVIFITADGAYILFHFNISFL
jgi:hypothetical protein